jgi:hypothetical protein
MPSNPNVNVLDASASLSPTAIGSTSTIPSTTSGNLTTDLTLQSFSSSSSTSKVTFENLAIGNTGKAAYSDPSGFTFRDAGGSDSLQIYGSGSGFQSKVLQSSNWGRTIQVTKTGGGNFDLAAFDYAASSFGDKADATVTGYLANGSTKIANFTASSKQMQTLSLDWAGLTRVEINFATGANAAYGALDNFVFGAGQTSSQPGSSTVPVIPPPSTGTRSQIGTNLAGIADWSSEIPFVDMFKTSREWISQRQGAKWGEGGPLKLTTEGWIASLAPGQFAETVMMTGKTFPAGRYTLLYDGEGKLDFTFANAKIISQSPGKMIVDVTPDEGGVFLRLLETNSSNPVRNIRFIMPGFENTYQTQPFNPIFLERLSNFSTLRFMDWAATNNSTLANWGDRITTNSATQATSKGVALEYMIQLANTLKIDPWFTIPAQASDEYVRNFATMVRDRLDPSLTVHIEYSNEVWNTLFSQAAYAGQKGLERRLDNTSFGAGLRYYSERSVEIFKIWETVFGSSTNQRVERVLAGHAANPWVGEQILGWKDAYKHADAYAIAPYFDGFGDADGDGWSDINDVDRVNITINMTPDQIIDGMLKEIPTEIKAMFDSNASVTKRFGVDLLAYEGGAHLTSYQFPSDKLTKMTDLFTAVNRNARMRDVYKAYLDQWKASGGSDFNHFNDVTAPSKWGFWGALEYQNQNPTTAPKYQGIMDFIKANPQG